jgi:hypothetical protein
MATVFGTGSLSGTFGSLITEGSWTSQTCDVSLGSFRSDFNGYWGKLRFRYEPGDSDSDVKVDILNTSNVVLLSDITLSDSGNFKLADLSSLTSVRDVDIKIKIRLRALKVAGTVSDVTLSWNDTEAS